MHNILRCKLQTIVAISIYRQTHLDQCKWSREFRSIASYKSWPCSHNHTSISSMVKKRKLSVCLCITPQQKLKIVMWIIQNRKSCQMARTALEIYHLLQHFLISLVLLPLFVCFFIVVLHNVTITSPVSPSAYGSHGRLQVFHRKSFFIHELCWRYYNKLLKSLSDSGRIFEW